jgi:uncharacterized membrane protein
MSTFLLYLTILRVIHIVAGTLWVGSAVFYLFFVEPTVKSLGPAAPQFMQTLIEKRRYPMFMNAASILTIAAGALLYWSASGSLAWSWITSGPGLGFTVGSLTAIVVFGIGFFMIRPRAERMGALSQAIRAASGPPTATQTAELHTLGEEMTRIERVDVILLSISLVLMATARYWYF